MGRPARVRALWGLLLVLPLLPLATVGAEPEQGAHVTDPAGDARYFDANWAASQACGQVLDPDVRAACAARAALVPHEGGLPAPPRHDILAAWFEDTPQHLVVALELAEVQPEARGIVSGYDYALVIVCWTVDERRCTGATFVEAAILILFQPEEGPPHLLPIYASTGDERCSLRGQCAMNVELAVEPGTPGRLVWTIPRAFLASADLSDVLDRPVASIVFATQPEVQTAGARARTPLADQELVRATAAASMADVTEEGRPFAFTTPQAPVETQIEPRAVTVAGPGGFGPVRPDVDLLEFEVLETPSTMTVAAQVARVDETPEDQTFALQFSVGGPAIQTALTARAGARAISAGACGDPACSRWLTFQPKVEVAPGEPGWINVTFDRHDLGAPAAGAFVTWTQINLYGFRTERQGAGEVEGEVATRVAWDLAGYAPPYRLLHDTAARAGAEDAAVFEDDVGDVALPRDVLDRTLASRFDLTFLEVKGVSPGETRFTLGVQDLSRVEVPPLYDAVFYAVAVETEDGAHMIGYYKDAQRQEFLCAQDVTVLAPEPADPNSVVWQAIQGLVSVGSASEGPGGSGSGSAGSSITFFVPHACFDKDRPEALEAKRVVAASFLVRTLGAGAGRSATVERLDDVASDGPVLLGVRSVPVPRPWYAAPFGVENFWDILGIGLAVVVTGAGAGLVQRRRSALKRYLRDVERALAVVDARERATALRELRDRLRSDLLRNRISEGHYVIAERRIDEHLGAARTAAVAAALPDLPHWLLLELGLLVADGEMSREDYARFSARLETTRLTKAAKEEARARVAAWVREDAAEPQNAPDTTL